MMLSQDLIRLLLVKGRMPYTSYTKSVAGWTQKLSIHVLRRTAEHFKPCAHCTELQNHHIVRNITLTGSHRKTDDKEKEDSDEYREKRIKSKSADFVKKRFYNIQRATEYAKQNESDIAVKRGVKGFVDGNSDEFQSNQQSVNRPDFHLSTELRGVEKHETKSPAIYRYQGGEAEPIVKSFLSHEEKTDDAIVYGNEKYEIVSPDQLTVKVDVPKLYHLAPLVNESKLLKSLVEIGVDLTKIEKTEFVDKIVKQPFKDIKPLLLYLHDIGVPGENVGALLSKNPALLLMDLDDIKARVRYLRSKKFASTAIIEMINRHSFLLNLPTVELDKSLGQLQKALFLTGQELRDLVTYAPKLITLSPFIIQRQLHMFRDVLEFTDREIKQLVLNYGSILKENPEKVADNFHYLHEVMEIPHSLIITWPEALKKNIQRIKTRHIFLRKLGRNQYKPELPNFVSLKQLLATKDEEFSVEIAKASLAEYNTYLRTI